MPLVRFNCVVVFLAAISAISTAGEPPRVADKVDWPAFLSRHDLVWESLPVAWHEGAFIGNGLLGAMIYSDKEAPLRWDLGRSDVTEHPPHGNHRLHIGEMVLRPAGKVLSGTMRLDLWNALVSGQLKTDRGEISLRSFTHAVEKVIVSEMTTTQGEEAARWEFRPGLSANPRALYKKEKPTHINPEPKHGKEGEIEAVVQPRTSGGEYATAWQELRPAAGKRLLILSVGESFPKTGGQQEAIDNVRRAASLGTDGLLASHQTWWHRYYPQSFMSIPDTRLESFYWIQIYKLASATRADRPAIDLMGPWFRTTPWPAIWWNLNIQLTYWPVYGSNRLELGQSLCRMLDNGLPNLIKNVPEKWREDSAAIGRVSSYDCAGPASKELCNLPWTCHNYWLQYRHCMDDLMLREKLFPLLRCSINYYLHLLEKGPDGKLHLPIAISPEYPKEAADTNIDLALLRWGCQTLLDTCARLRIEDPLIPIWKRTLADLTPYPVDSNGLMIGRDVPLAESHRHFSHLLAIYPLYLLNWDQPQNRDLITKSLDHWINFKGALQGYSYTGAASISASIGRRDEAVRLLNEFLDRYVKSNTMYLEAGPVIETPLAGASSIHDLLLQSWGDKIRVFPAVPGAWKDVVIHNMRAQGAFLISAVRREGQTKFIQIESLAGEPCRIQTDLASPVRVLARRDIKIKTIAAEPHSPFGQNIVELSLQKGDSALLYSGEQLPDCTIGPAPADDRMNFYGSRKAASIKPGPDGSFHLPASKAAVHGELLFYEKSDVKDNLGRWINPDDYASWNLLVDRPGRYAVSVELARPGAGEGHAFSVTLGASQITGRVKGTGDWYKFEMVPVGTIEIPAAGKYDLTIRAVNLPPKSALMNLKSLHLTRQP